MLVEFCDGAGYWHLLEGATFVREESDAYEISISGLARMWLAKPETFIGLLLRLDGHDMQGVIYAATEGDLLVLLAFMEPTR